MRFGGTSILSIWNPGSSLNLFSVVGRWNLLIPAELAANITLLLQCTVKRSEFEYTNSFSVHISDR